MDGENETSLFNSERVIQWGVPIWEDIRRVKALSTARCNQKGTCLDGVLNSTDVFQVYVVLSVGRCHVGGKLSRLSSLGGRHQLSADQGSTTTKQFERSHSRV